MRYALRGMRRSPGFTAVAVLSLALGIGANTAIFGLVDTVMLRMLPVQHPEQLVALLLQYPNQPHQNGSSRESYEHFRDHNHVFSALTGMSKDNLLNVRTGDSEPEIMTGEYVPGNYFPVLGVKPAVGRLIGPEDAPNSVAVVSWSCWKTRFHLDPAILGRRIVVQDKPATIVGVTPREFFGVVVGSRTDVWLPRSAEMGLSLFGRLRPGVTLQQARAEMSVLYRFTMAEHARIFSNPLAWQTHVELEPAGTGLSPMRDRFGIWRRDHDRARPACRIRAGPPGSPRGSGGSFALRVERTWRVPAAMARRGMRSGRAADLAVPHRPIAPSGARGRVSSARRPLAGVFPKLINGVDDDEEEDLPDTRGEVQRLVSCVRLAPVEFGDELK